MLAEAIQDGVKAPAKRRRRAAPSRGLFDRLRGFVLFEAVDGRGTKAANTNGPFEERRSLGLYVAAAIPGLVLLATAGALAWHPLKADPDTLTTIAISAPSQTPVERKLIGKVALLREGLWEARLTPWEEIPSKGMARVSNGDMHEALADLIGEITTFGQTVDDRAPPGIVRDRVFLAQIADYRSQLKAIEAKLGTGRSIIVYHLGLLALWAGDAADAEPQFQSLLEIAQRTEAIDAVGRQRLDGLQASANYGLGLAAAARHDWSRAITDFDASLGAACRASADGPGDSGFKLTTANLVALDTRAVRNDRLIALVRGRSDDDLHAITSPTCAQLMAPAKAAPTGDADVEARALFGSLAIDGDPVLAANLELRAALMGERDTVQRLYFDGAGASADVMQAQSLARAVAGLDTEAGGVDRSALTDIQHLSALKARLDNELRGGSLSEPESDPTWNWSDPSLFGKWKAAVGASLAGALLAQAADAAHDNPGLAAALYNVVLDNSSWMPASSVTDAWWRVNTGMSLGFALWMLAISASLSGVLFLILKRWRETYRTTFESWHHEDRLHAPEG
ncbi:MAG: hypothetical protein ISS15_14855 [Alphaproteobacteria bacterium]|nr:hypothetical protein [Alphaproteobacteria bacterium]MBL6937597.1 hypothetical protein [Alphaproteobacteria bacterium]MBL7098935.1 hypothetical protein [Alphaproteobacteria bacterium]